MKRLSILTIFTLLLALTVVAVTKNPNKKAFANRISITPKIDGILDDHC